MQKKIDAGLPALIGSPKQIAWAEKIRAKAIERGALSMVPLLTWSQTVVLMRKRNLMGGDEDSWTREYLPILVAGGRQLESNIHRTDARWWIDNRAVITDGPLHSLRHLLIPLMPAVHDAWITYCTRHCHVAEKIDQWIDTLCESLA